MIRILKFFLVLFVSLCLESTRAESAECRLGCPFSLALQNETRPRSTLWAPLASLLLPGFDQWLEGQYRAAIIYSGTSFVALSVAAQASENLKKKELSRDTSDLDRVDEDRDPDFRWYLIGGQTYQMMGSLSAYHSFRSAVRTQQTQGRFLFLKKEEDSGDILLAPFNARFLMRPTSYVPLGLLGALAVYGVASSKTRPIHGGDAAFLSAVSYNAGTGEEALFRGWLMPQFQETFNSGFWSNTATSTLFSLAHVSSSNRVPWPQFLVGWYLGWLAQKNDWTISEGVFIHAWWDVISFAASYSIDPEQASIYLPLYAGTF